MKKKFFFTLALFWCALLSFGQTFISNGLNYSITSATTAEVAANSGLNGSYNILATVSYNGTDYTVTAIGYKAFYQNNDLTAITIPNTITNIGSLAFYGCSGLTSVVLPDSVVSMEIGVFLYCSSLTSVTLSNSLTSILDSTFNECTSLTSISIPNSVTIIGTAAFSNSGLSSVTIPSSVTFLGVSAFYECTNLTSITIPDTVTSVGENLLANCTQLTSAVISNSITTLPDNIFNGCINLSSFNIPGNITKIGGRAFQNCTGLTSILIPDTITNISYEAFSGCTGLTTINIPSSVSVISDLAFAYCTNLNSVYVNWIQPIGIYNNVFYNITLSQVSLYVPQGTYFNYQQPYSIWPSFGQIIDPCGIPTFNTTTVSICDSYTWGNNGQTYTSSGIYTGTTTNCVIEKLDLTISNQYGFEFDGIYYYATSATTAAAGGYSTASGTVIIPTTVSDVCGTYTVTSIDSYAFSDFSDLTSISIPNSVTSIGDNAFSDSTNLTSITIPDSVTSIGESVFDSCTGLISVTIPNSVISIGESAFNDCSGLTSINIPNSVTSIGYSAFSRCTGLTTVSIPNSVISIDDYAFFGCTNLSSVTVGWFNPLAITPEVFFEMMLNNITLYVPSGSIAEYESAAVWQDFSPITPGCSILTNNTTTAAACESYTWSDNGQTYTTSGVYTGSTTNCVTEKLNLTITPSTDNTLTISACGSYFWSETEQTYSFSGIYTAGTYNCVTRKLNLTITPSTDNTTPMAACDSYTWNGTTYTASGVYTGSTTNCVTEKLDLTITPSSDNITNAIACDAYTWNNTTYTASGVYTGSITNCVTEKLNLTINNSPVIVSQPTPIVFCSNTTGAATVAATGIGLTYQWQYSVNGGSYINGNAGEPGNNTDSISGITNGFSGLAFRCVITSSNGCLTATNWVSSTVNPAPSLQINGATTGCDNVTLTAVGGNSITWSGGSTPNSYTNTFTVSGTYSATVTGDLGCTATISKIVNVTPSTDNTTPIAACDSYTWNGTTYTTSGVYTGTTTNCVTEKLDLTISPSSVNTTTASACDSYTWANNGQTYTINGVYTGLTANCVTEMLDLTISPSLMNTTTASACGSYTWANNGQTYTTSGVFAGSVTNCVTEMLDLTINNSITPLFSQIASVCSGTTLSALSETSNNSVSGTWSPALNNLATTTYTFTPSAGQCANTTTLTITVNTLNSTLSLANGTISSNQPDGNFQWVNCANNNEPISGEISQSFTPTINGQYAVNIELDNCTTTSECINIDFLKVEDFNSFSKIIIFPNPAIFELNIKTDYKIVGIKIIDILGKVSNISNFANNKINVSNLSEGMYFLEIKTENGLFKEKFIKK